MPSVSPQQRTLFCIVQSMHEGKTPKSYSKEAAKMMETVSLEKAKEYCEAPVEKK